MESDSLFRSLVTEPLLNAVGKPLLSVAYRILEFDVQGFRVDRPNLTGIVSLILRFPNVTLVIMASSNKPLRLTNAFHVEVARSSDDKFQSESHGSVRLTEIAASNAPPWRAMVGSLLQSVGVYGMHGSPQTIRFQFQVGSAIATIGYSDEDPLAGDGDEILIASDEQWARLKKFWPGDWTKQWESGSPEDYNAAGRASDHT